MREAVTPVYTRTVSGEGQKVSGELHDMFASGIATLLCGNISRAFSCVPEQYPFAVLRPSRNQGVFDSALNEKHVKGLG